MCGERSNETRDTAAHYGVTGNNNTARLYSRALGNLVDYL